MVPVYEEILMDLETPVSFYNRLKKSRHSFLLESVEGSERWARYSFLGTAPELVFKAWGHEVEITRGREDRVADLRRSVEGAGRDPRRVPACHHYSRISPSPAGPWVTWPTTRWRCCTGSPTPRNGPAAFRTSISCWCARW